FGQGDAAAGAIGGVQEADGQRVVRVAAAGGEVLATARARTCATGAAPAECLGQDVLQVLRIEAGLTAVMTLARGVGVVAIEWTLRRHLVAGRVDLAAVIAGALVGVREQFVGDADLLEPLGGLGLAGIHVGMVLFGEF